MRSTPPPHHPRARGKNLKESKLEPLNYNTLMERFIHWAQERPDLRAVIVIGSQARGISPADEWSDLDLLVITHRPEDLFQETDWLDSLGPVWLTFLEKTATGRGKERRVLFEGGLDVDFIPLSPEEAHEFLLNTPPSEITDILRRGYRILLDKDCYAEQLQSLPLQSPSPFPPSPEQWLNLVNDFWYHTLWTAKKLRRGEIWVAKACCDGYMKLLLLQCLEWHAKAIRGGDYDTWFRGRFLERWADPLILAELRKTFARYDEKEVKEALYHTALLFRRLALETAQKLKYDYPSSAEEKVWTLVSTLMSGV